MAITNPETIINETLELTDSFRNILLSMNETAVKYSKNYDIYTEKNIYDSLLLKNKMKEIVLKVGSDAI